MKRPFLLLVILLFIGGALWIVSDLLRPYRGYSGNEVVVVEPGSGIVQVTDLLAARGVLRHRLPFLVLCWAGSRRPLRAGEYLFDRPLCPIDIYRKLIHGDVYLHTVVIPEGSDSFDIARILHQRLGIDPAQFLDVVRETSAIRDLDSNAPSLEGYLFPDTYRFPRGTSAGTVVIAMLGRFRHILSARFAGDLPSTPAGLHEVMTLASLVEKETPELSERSRVAGVFARRLERGIPLQCDPTVIYAARVDRQPAGPITREDLQRDSPYNTYRHAGLPPGPISNPGEASIRAALHPADDDALYFVANHHGGHVFARTLAEHQHNVARYRRELAKLRRSEQGTAGGKAKLPAGEASKSTARTRKSAGKTHQEADHP